MIDKFSFFPDSPQVRKLVTGFESESDYTYKREKYHKIWRFYQFYNQKSTDQKKDDFMDTHQYISECLTNLVFSQIARKCDISWQDLNLKTPTY